MKDHRVDSYIARSAEFAKPILEHVRRLAHEACPEVEETLKWSFPHFVHKGILFGMAAFKNHCSLIFWKGALIFDGKPPRKSEESSMGQFGRITALSDLPSEKVLLGHMKKAVRLNDAGVKVPGRSVSKPRKKLVVPAYFISALRKDQKAFTAFENFSYSHRKEYVRWITDAKTEETRNKRIKTAIEWLADGKPHNWKYIKC